MMLAISYRFEEAGWEQLDFFEAPKKDWIGPLFWPDSFENFCKSLEHRAIIARIDGHFIKQGDVWQLIPLT